MFPAEDVIFGTNFLINSCPELKEQCFTVKTLDVQSRSDIYQLHSVVPSAVIKQAELFHCLFSSDGKITPIPTSNAFAWLWTPFERVYQSLCEEHSVGTKGKLSILRSCCVIRRDGEGNKCGTVLI